MAIKEPPVPRSFLSFYWTLAMRALLEAYGVVDTLLTFLAFIFFGVGLFSKKFGIRLEEQWKGWSRWYSIVPLVLLFGYRVARANYEHFESLAGKMDDLQNELGRERERLLQPEVGLVWGWPERYRNNMEQFERGSEKFILVHNRSTDYIHNIQVQPIVMDTRVEFDFIPEIAPSKMEEAIGRWDSKTNPGQKNSSLTTNYVYFFADNEERGVKSGWYQAKPHNRGLTDVWWKVPITVAYQSRGVNWQSTFEFTYDFAEGSCFSLLSSKRL